MSVQTLSTNELADGAAEPGAYDPTPHALRILAAAAVFLGVAALAAATFVLSYSPIRAVALQAGVTPRFARGYPILLDAMLVIVLAALLGLRGAGLVSRFLAWITLLLVMAAAAGADALHAAGHSLPHQAAAITAAILPFALVLVAFALLLAILRHARLSRRADAADRASGYGSGWVLAQPEVAQVTAPQVTTAQVTMTLPAETAAGAFGSSLGAPTLEDAQPQQALAADSIAADPVAADPSPDGSVSEPATGTTPYPSDALATGWYDDDSDPEPEYSALADEDAEVGADAYAEPDEDDGPVFHRLFSAPVLLEVETTEDAAVVEATESNPTELEATLLDDSEPDTTEPEAETAEAPTN
jgi:TRAP-type C4-dicarboxylate transport system permease small subunit